MPSTVFDTGFNDFIGWREGRRGGPRVSIGFENCNEKLQILESSCRHIDLRVFGVRAFRK
jgi:hypothetical protein